MLAEALKQRHDLKAQQDREAQARMSANATKLERLPTVGAFNRPLGRPESLPAWRSSVVRNSAPSIGNSADQSA